VASASGWQPYHLHVPIVLKCGSLKLLEPSGPPQVCNGIEKKRTNSHDSAVIRIILGLREFSVYGRYCTTWVALLSWRLFCEWLLITSLRNNRRDTYCQDTPNNIIQLLRITTLTQFKLIRYLLHSYLHFTKAVIIPHFIYAESFKEMEAITRSLPCFFSSQKRLAENRNLKWK